MSGVCSHFSLSGTTVAVRTRHSPGAVCSTKTWRPAYSLPIEIWPLLPITFTTVFIPLLLLDAMEPPCAKGTNA